MQTVADFTQSQATDKAGRETTDSGEATLLREFIDPADFREYHEYLAAVRKARRMSKTDVARASRVDNAGGTGVANSILSKIEYGKYGQPGFKLMIRVARGYGVPIASLARFFR